MSTICSSSRLGVGSAVRWGLAMTLLASPALGGERGPWAAAELTSAEAELAWWLPLPLRFTASIRSYHLLDNYLYAIGTDGKVRCIRADTGEFRWTAQIAPPGETLWPPQLYSGTKSSGVVFVRLHEAILLDPASGVELDRVNLRSPSSASPTFAENRAYIPSVDRRVIAYDLEKNYVRWQVSTPGPLLVPPLYLAGEDTLVFADYSGRIAACDAMTKVKRFARQLNGEPRGWLAADAEAIYVTSAGDPSLLHALDHRTGNTLWQYRLANRPEGGPVVTATSVFQAVSGGGVHRIGLNRDFPNWYAKGARKFLAQWPHRVALLMQDGSIGFIETETGRPLQPLRVKGFTDGVSNVWNDVVIVGNERGEVRCLRPAGAPPLAPKDFGATTRPASQPASPAGPVAATKPE